MKTVIGVTTHNNTRMGQSSRAAHKPRVRLKSSDGISWLAEDHNQHHAQDGLRNFKRCRAGRAARDRTEGLRTRAQ